LSEQRKLIEENFKNGTIKIIVATPTLAIGVDLPAFRVIIRDLKRYGLWGMEYIPVLEYHQQTGRAGRPSYDTYGEAIILADSDNQKDELKEKYIDGLPEEIISKLASEPIMRTYILSLIASEFVHDKKSLEAFFAKTFYARQYGDSKKLNNIIKKMIDQLQEWEFIKHDADNKRESKKTDFVSALKLSFNEPLDATLLGKRVSELYLDPYTAHDIIESLRAINMIQQKKDSDKEVNELTYLQVLCSCLELRPLLRVKTAEFDKMMDYLNENENHLLEVTEMYDDTYDEFLAALKTARFFTEWLDEKDEEYLLEKYDVRPGEINAKKDKADWLLYSSMELSKLLKLHSLIKELSKLRFRLQYGVKEELIPLLQLRNVGRVRARTMFKNNIRDIADVKKADYSNLAHLLGKNVALDIKKQVGQEYAEEKVKVKENKRKGQISLNDY
jgi:helicase